MGPLSNIIEMMPGFNVGKLKGINIDDSELTRVEAIIKSMTKDERRNPSIISGSRRRRIAQGSGTKIQDVNRLLKQFHQTKKLMKQFGDMEKGPVKVEFRFSNSVLFQYIIIILNLIGGDCFGCEDQIKENGSKKSPFLPLGCCRFKDPKRWEIY